MASQAHLFIGERVGNWKDIERVAGVLSIDLVDISELSCKSPNISIVCDQWTDAVQKRPLRKVHFRGAAYDVVPHLMYEREGGSEFPAPAGDAYTDAMIGFELTSRYAPAILDIDHARGGRPEPFEIDVEACASILAEVRAWWPTAGLYIWEIWH